MSVEFLPAFPGCEQKARVLMTTALDHLAGGRG